MATAFGVQLKKADVASGANTDKSVTITPGGARRSEFKLKPVSDLKAMFDKTDEKADASPKMLLAVKKTPGVKTKQSDSKPDSNKTSFANMTAIKATPELATKLSAKDKEDFEHLKDKLNHAGIEKLIEADQPNVVVAKTFSGTGQTYKATVDNKVAHSESSKTTVVSKSEAASLLSFGLTKLRTRPDSVKVEGEQPKNLSEDKTTKKPVSEKLSLENPLSTKAGDANKDLRYQPGVARGWKSRSGVKGETEHRVGKFSDGAVGKIRADAEKELEAKNFRSVSPENFSVNSSDDSSGSSILSPRGYKSSISDTKTKVEVLKSDVNESIRKLKNSDSYLFRHNRTDIVKSSIPKTTSGSKLSAVEQLGLDKDRIHSNRNSGSFSSDSERSISSPRGKDEIKLFDNSRISLEESKQQGKVKVEGHSVGKGRRSLDQVSSSGSNSSLKQSEKGTGKLKSNKLPAEEVSLPAENGENKHSLLSRRELNKREVGTSRKLGTLKFQDIKKGFETKAIYTRNESPSSDRKPLEIKRKQTFLERKHSFEGGEIFRQKSYEKAEVISPRDKGNVLQTVKTFTELDAKARAKPSVVRRTQSLPIENLGNDSSLDYEDIGSEALYHDIEGIRVIDDISNEGDVSSETDLYEEIPATSALNSESAMEFKNRRGIAFRKRKKLLEEQDNSGEQTGSEGDIDSDTDSSNSGIYELVDREEDEVLSESDSINQDPPELPPARIQGAKKKKDRTEKTKGLKGKIKKLYKGKSMDSESALKSVTASGLAVTPQSAGLMDRFKNHMKKQKSGTSLESLSREDNPVCESEGTDTDLERNSPRSVESHGQGQGDLAPPPLPPRRSSTSDVTRLNNAVEVPPRKSTNVEDLNNAVSSNTEPPLPPRNRISNNLNLDFVVPVHPGGDKRKSAWPPGKDSYLHGQKINNTATTDIPYIDQSPSPKSPTSAASDAPPLPQRPSPAKRQTATSTSSNDSYVDVGDKISQRKNVHPHDSYVDFGDKISQRKSVHPQDSYEEVDAPLPDTDYSLAEEIRGPGAAGRKELEKRPVSSSYIKPHDLASVPEPRTVQAPFEDVFKFCSQYEEDGIYVEFSDDQVYGKLGGQYKSQFETESLYQFYNKEKITRASKRKAIYSSFDESDEEGYFEEEGDKGVVYEDLSAYSSGRGSLELEKKPEEEPKNKQISTLEMFGKKGTVLRALWAEMPEVKDSGILNTISPHERKLQESMFEIITSEATYLRSLNVLINVFLMSEEFGSDHSNKCVITKQERHVLFSNIGTIRDTSERFLAALEAQWKVSVMLSEKICDIISEHASKNFECYVHYCSNQAFQDRAVSELKKKPDFADALCRLESHPDCQGLPMISFLLLPMQRVTRLPLLVDAICHRIDPIKDKARHKAAVNAFNALSKVVKKCNEGAKKMQQTEQMYHIAKQIDFPASKEIPQIPLISSSRYLVKQGEVTRIVSEAASRLPFGKAKPGKQAIHIYLFNDIMLITKKKGERYVVTDYGQRNALHVEMIENPEKHPRVLPLGVPGGCKYLFLLVMLENYEKKQVEMVFSCNSTSDRARWVDAVTPVKVTDDQRIYEEWDCPQVQCIKKYVAKEPDELTLEESDVVNVFKKLEDGMYEGERLRDGERGWFPKDHTEEIVNSHVRARNLRMKYRLMQASGEYA